MSGLATAVLGRTGLRVSKLAYGAMELRRRDLLPERIRSILEATVDCGINLIDTSPDYGRSEECLGEVLSHRRGEVVLASKCGCPIGHAPGERSPHSYTRANVRSGVEQSLLRLRTDYLDLVQVHMSPSRRELEVESCIEELARLREEGKVRFIGMSGVLPHLADHLAMGVFDAFQIPYSALEREHEEWIDRAAAAGAGVIVRGGMAQGIPTLPADRFPEKSKALYAERRALWEASQLDDLLNGRSRMEFMLRFALSHPGVTSVVVGTVDPRHLAANLAAARKGPLPAEEVLEAKRRLASAQAGAAA